MIEYKKIVDLSHEEAKNHFLKGNSYFNSDLPKYISFEPVLNDVATVLNNGNYTGYKAANPNDFPNVNYSFIANKDGKIDWRPLELIHPAVYVSLVNIICDSENWNFIINRLEEFKDGSVHCCSAPVMSLIDQTDAAMQVRSWWQSFEQQSLMYSLKFSHILHTDVIDCYNSLYTHSISWALHGQKEAKKKKRDKNLLGNQIDSHIQAGRYGQTNGISQGTVLMDFIAEIVLGYIDNQINKILGDPTDFRILRYRDDYRIFANSDDKAEKILKIISDELRTVGMKLGVSKTISYKNVVEGSIKPDKLAGIDLQDLGEANAKTLQKQLLRLHQFGRKHPNSGALRRLVSEFHNDITKQVEMPDDLEVQIAIATDIGFVSPVTFPAIAGILSHLISLAPEGTKPLLWKKVQMKMSRVPHNGYLEIWLQRVTQPKTVGIRFESKESICRIVNGESVELWENDWISSKELKKALETSKIVISQIDEVPEVVQPEEIELFKQKAWTY